MRVDYILLRVTNLSVDHSILVLYQRRWQKVRSIWAYIHDNYFDDYGYFHLSGDDNHFIIENMRNYLWSLNDHDGELPLHIGHRYRKNPHNICGGGSGYTFNKATLRIFVEKVLPQCHTSERTSAEDKFVGLCLGEHGIHCHNTADIRGGQRYIGLKPKFAATFNGDAGVSMKHCTNCGPRDPDIG